MNELPPMTLLDYKISNRENNMLKALIPYVDKDFQPLLATYIKYTELRSTIELFAKGGTIFDTCNQGTDMSTILSAIMPYVSPAERESFENMSNIINVMNMFETYKDMFNSDAFNSDMFNSDIFDSNTSDSNMPNSDMFESDNLTESDISSMLSPEQQLMFEHLSGLLNQ